MEKWIVEVLEEEMLVDCGCRDVGWEWQWRLLDWV
jgi:hypothetical protein